MDVDLYLCASCNRRFVAEATHPTTLGRCRGCGGPLELKVRSIPGRHDLVAGALHAELLEGSGAGSLPERGTRPGG